MKARHMMKAVALVTIISAVTRVMAFVFKIYLSRVLGAEVLGVYQITMSLFLLFMAFSSSGIPAALSRHLAELGTRGDIKGSQGMLTTGLIISSAIALTMMALSYIFPNVTALLFSDERCTQMFFIMLPALFSTGVYAIIRSYFWGNRQYLLYSMAEFVEEVLSILIVVSCIILGIYHDDMSRCIAVAFVVSDYVGMFLLIALFFIKGGRLAKPTLMHPLMASAMPMTSTRILGSIVSSMMALTLPALLVHAGMDMGDATASYGRASGMVMSLIFTPSTIVGSLAIVVIPELASENAEHKNLDRVIIPALNFSIIIACLFLALFLGVGDRLCSFLYDDDIAGDYMAVASLVMLPMSINQICVSVLNTMGYENKTFLTHIICSVVLGILILILPKYIGIYAYFVGLIVFHTVSSIIYLSMLNKRTRLGSRDTMKALYVIIFAILSGFALRIGSRLIKGDFVSVILASILILILFYVFLYSIGLIRINILSLKRHSK